MLVVSLNERVDEHAKRERRTSPTRTPPTLNPTIPASPQRIGRNNPATRRQGTADGRTGVASTWRGPDRANVAVVDHGLQPVPGEDAGRAAACSSGPTRRPSGASYFLCSSFLTSLLISFFSGTGIHLLPHPRPDPESVSAD